MFPVSDSIVHLDARRTRLFSIACFAFLLLSLVLAILPSSARATDEASTAAAASSAVSASSADTQSAVPSATLISGSTTFAPVAEPTPRRTIRAGLADMDTNGGANRTVEFEKDYLQAIAEYANGHEYVYAPWCEFLQMSRTGRRRLSRLYMTMIASVSMISPPNRWAPRFAIVRFALKHLAIR